MQPKPPRVFNPMPESLDDVQIGPTPNMGGQFGELPQEHQEGTADPRISSRRSAEIDSIVASRITDNMINKEILDEKIRQDITSIKKEVQAPQGPKDVLKALIARGDYREDVELFGHIWTMKALSQGDIIAAFNDIKDDNSSAVGKVATLTISQIAYAVEACDGQSIYEWFPDIINRQDFGTTEEFKLAVRRIFRRYLEQMASTTLNALDAAYTTIEKKRNEALVELKKS
jgi:hypothetical protein